MSGVVKSVTKVFKKAVKTVVKVVKKVAPIVLAAAAIYFTAGAAIGTFGGAAGQAWLSGMPGWSASGAGWSGMFTRAANTLGFDFAGQMMASSAAAGGAATLTAAQAAQGINAGITSQFGGTVMGPGNQVLGSSNVLTGTSGAFDVAAPTWTGGTQGVTGAGQQWAGAVSPDVAIAQNEAAIQAASDAAQTVGASAPTASGGGQNFVIRAVDPNTGGTFVQTAQTYGDAITMNNQLASQGYMTEMVSGTASQVSAALSPASQAAGTFTTGEKILMGTQAASAGGQVVGGYLQGKAEEEAMQQQLEAEQARYSAMDTYQRPQSYLSVSQGQTPGGTSNTGYLGSYSTTLKPYQLQPVRVTV
jgi:hypothetical protein